MGCCDELSCSRCVTLPLSWFPEHQCATAMSMLLIYISRPKCALNSHVHLTLDALSPSRQGVRLRSFDCKVTRHGLLQCCAKMGVPDHPGTDDQVDLCTNVHSEDLHGTDGHAG
jgi:hypothetical protein